MSVFVQSIEGPDILAFAGLDRPWVREGWRQAIQTMGLFVPFLITTAMFFQLYYLVPKPHPRKRSAFSGALLAGVLWEVAKQIFTYYATYIGHFDRYATEGLGALGNTFALIIAFVFWVYFSGVVLMLGAVVASLREHRHVTSGLLPGERSSSVPEVSPTQPHRAHGQPPPATDVSAADVSAEAEASPAERPQPAVAPTTDPSTRSQAHPQAHPAGPETGGDGAQPDPRPQSTDESAPSPEAESSRRASEQPFPEEAKPSSEETTNPDTDIPSTSSSASADG